MIGVGPCGPVVGDEIGEHHAVAANVAVAYRRDIHERAAWHAVRRGGLDRQGEGELLVDHGDVTRRSDALPLGIGVGPTMT